MEKKERCLKRTVIGLYLAYYLVLIYAFYRNARLQDMTALMLGFVAMLTPWIVPVVFRLFKLKRIYEIDILNIIFVFFASLVGSCLSGYALPYFDKVVHFASGLLLCQVVYMLYSLISKRREPTSPEERRLVLCFNFVGNGFVALLWEFYEYAMLVFFNYDCIKHFSTGVHDSLTDMLAGTLGGLVMCLCYYQAFHSGKDNFFTRLHNRFYDANIQKNA
ncbi:MAG TPA: hypothetical protein IAD15_09620 [Candidatus Fimiplasma intestinipullorum]|uniref:Membrane-spanning protein n=1 Tax=Candidatus Fimiplasma intestinipullorum TaxID=2840825 RepID=A0A9D1HPT5_9FIRM|nr:hypothetical protein [Candidatus Fimiplasma intestinipullorum]